MTKALFHPMLLLPKYMFGILLALVFVCEVASASDGISPPGGSTNLSSEGEISIISNLEEGEFFVIDVLFIYSPEVLDLVGSEVALHERIDEVLETANQTFQNSSLRLLVEKAHVALSPVSEDDEAPNLLAEIASTEAISTLRDESDADIVSFLISHTSDNQHCGNAYVLEALNESANQFGHQVVSLHSNCANWVFTHELGHNLGAEHDEENAGSEGLFSYARGHRFQSDFVNYRTVMALGIGEVVNVFSSPSMLYQGIPTGTLTADNTRVLEESMGFVSAYRGDSKTNPSPSLTLTNSQTKKRCDLNVQMNPFLEGSEIQLKLRKRNNSSKTIKTVEAQESEIVIPVKRGKKTKRFWVTYDSNEISTDSNEVICKRKRKKNR